MLPAVLVTLFELLPLLYLVARTLDAGENGWRFLLRSRTLEVVLNTAALAGSVAISTIAIGVPLAWLTSRTDLPGRAFWSAAASLPLVIPSYIGAVVMVAAFGPRGMLQSALAPFRVERLPSIYGVWRIVADPDALHLSLRLSHRASGVTEPRSVAGRGRPLSRLRSLADVPGGHPAAASPRGGGWGVLTVLYTLGDFGVVTLLRYDAFTRAICVQYRSALDRAARRCSRCCSSPSRLPFWWSSCAPEATRRFIASAAAPAGERGRFPWGTRRIPAVLFCAVVVG